MFHDGAFSRRRHRLAPSALLHSRPHSATADYVRVPASAAFSVLSWRRHSMLIMTIRPLVIANFLILGAAAAARPLSERHVALHAAAGDGGQIGAAVGVPASKPLAAPAQSAAGVWSHQGTVIRPVEGDEDTVLEPTVIHEGSPRLLTGYASVFKMWYDAGWSKSAGEIWYAESPDGVIWTRDSSPAVSGHYRTHVHKEGSTYYMFTANIAQKKYDLYTSSDGRVFSLNTPGVLTSGATWDEYIENMSVFVERGTWYMLYDGKSDVFAIGLATAPAAAGPWTKWSGNPVMKLEGGSVTGPSEVKKLGNFYYVWLQRAATGALPTDIYRYRSSDLKHWTASPATITFPRCGVDEGAGTSIGQVADPTIVEEGVGPICITRHLLMGASPAAYCTSSWRLPI